MELTLKRVSFSDDGTAGVLIFGNRPLCVTLEEDWRDNAKSISCIPEGRYLCERYARPSGMDVPGRTYILFHPGTTEIDTEGCILTGKEFGAIVARDEQSGKTEKQLAVLRSKEAFQDLMGFLNGAATFVLHVKNC